MSVTAVRSALALVLEVTTITHTQPFRYIRHSLMFSKIPHKFSAPFGLLGDEAKLAFPTQPGGILKLATVRVRMLLSQYLFNVHLVSSRILARIFLHQIAIGTRCVVFKYYRPHLCINLVQYFTLFDSASDVFSLIAPHHGMPFHLLCGILTY